MKIGLPLPALPDNDFSMARLSPIKMTECFTQVLFWLSIGCLPLSIAFTVLGLRSSNRARSSCFLTAAPFCGAHFAWYIRSLGISLADKIGNAEYPDWSNHMLAAGAVSIALVGFRWSIPSRER